MFALNIVYSFALPFTIWLLYGAPDLTLQGNLALFIVVVLHLYCVIWYRMIFAMFSGDSFAYGMVALGINISSFITTFISGFFTFLFFDKSIQTLGMISPYSWGFIALGFFVTTTIPIVSSRHVHPLPKSTSRREYEDPTRKAD